MRICQMRPGTRKYYLCAKRECLEAAKQAITGDFLDIANVQDELTENDFEQLLEDGINIGATRYSKVWKKFSNHSSNVKTSQCYIQKG